MRRYAAPVVAIILAVVLIVSATVMLQGILAFDWSQQNSAATSPVVQSIELP